MKRALAALLACAGLGLLGAAPPAPAEVPLEAGMVITESVRIRPGVYRLADPRNEGVVVIRGEGIVVDFAGAELVGAPDGAAPDTFAGTGIIIEGGRDVTLRGAKVRGFKVAVRAERCPGVTVRGCDLSRNWKQRLHSTPEREDLRDWLSGHENDDDQWLRYGAALYLKGCRGATVAGNVARNGQNGICLVSCDDARVFDNDASFNSGWGIALWRSSRNEVSHNKADWCMRGFSHGVYHRGQDSAGIFVFEQCRDNLFAFNSATHGGDGFFLYAGHETVQRTGEGGCNGNVLYKNDFSHAAANGIEATFSADNVFAYNVLRECDHAIWAGYSYRTVIVGNEIADGNHGVSIEHGEDNLIEGNTFTNNRVAIDLWWDEDPDLVGSTFGKRRDGAPSRGYEIVRNRFEEGRALIRLRRTSAVRIESNVIADGVLELHGSCPDVTVADNWIGELETRTDRLEGTFAPGASRPYPPPADADLAVRRRVEPPAVVGSLDAFLPPGARRGWRWIFVDEWGPYDFTELRVHPRRKTGGREATFQVLGPGGRFEVTDVEGAVTVEPTAGELPAKVTVRAKEPGGLTELAFTVRAEGHAPQRVTGVLLATSWDVRHFAWKTDPRKSADAWKALLATEPIERRAHEQLDFVWGGGGPAGHPDRFGTLATAEVKLPKGSYRIETVSDDGIRVFMDDALVIDDWTWHAPKAHAADLELEAGAHRIRVEHFELDGHAQLQLRLLPRQ